MTAEAHNNLAVREQRAARHVSLHGYRPQLIIGLVLYVVYLLGIHAGDVRGFEVTLRLASAQEAGITVTEYLYSWFLAAGIGVFTTLTLLTRRTTFSWIAWMAGVLGLVMSVFSIWLRQTRANTGDGVDLSYGFYLSLVGVAIAVWGYSMVALRRSPEQKEIAHLRSQDTSLDAVGMAQQDAMISKQQRTYESNPLFVDDRRREAAKRHTKTNPDD